MISPKSIGLTNKVEIYKLIKESKILFSFCEWNNKIIPLMVFTINLLLFILNYSLLDLMIFGIPHSILYALCVHYNCCIIFLPLVYFYLICGYIKIKIKEQNDSSQKRLLSEKSLTVRKSYDRFMLWMQFIPNWMNTILNFGLYIYYRFGSYSDLLLLLRLIYSFSLNLW